ncbi:hypothetical protein Gohar_022414, partial [Gossypium harknessii]|nr:hypothetical protein [Gossypium harknessii]
ELLKGSGFLAGSQYRPGVQVGSETHQRVNRELQLGLPVDGSALTGSVQSADWGAICYDLLGVIMDNIYGGQIEMGWLRDTFLESGNDLTEVERIRYARVYILEMIGGYLMLDLLRNLEMCGATPPNKAKIRGYLSLLQSWARFRFLVLRLRVNHLYTFSLITRFRQSIPVAPEVLDDEYKIDLRERRGPLNPMRRDDGTGPSTAPTQSPGPTPQATTPTPQPFQIMPGIVVGGVARGTIVELISLPIPIALWPYGIQTPLP